MSRAASCGLLPGVRVFANAFSFLSLSDEAGFIPLYCFPSDFPARAAGIGPAYHQFV
jgi:hypothetical protein